MIKALVGLAVLAVLFVGCVTVLPFVLVLGGLGAMQAQLGATRHWPTHRLPLLADVNADGREDVVGWVRTVAAYETHLLFCAYDGRDGTELWCQDRGREAIGAPEPLAVRLGDRALLIDGRGTAELLRLADGSSVGWRTSLLAAAQEVCTASARVAVRTRDRSWLALDLVRGDAELIPHPPADCRTIPSDRVQTDSSIPVWIGEGFERRDWGGARTARGRRERGMRVAVARTDGSVLVWAGVSDDQLRNHAIVALRRDGADVWRATVPLDPLRAQVQAPEAVAVDGEHVFAVYELTSHGDAPRHAAAFRLADGGRVWDVPLERARGEAAGLVMAGSRDLIVGVRTQLWVLDRTTGAVRFVLGTAPPHR